jgi:hypothetical protein
MPIECSMPQAIIQDLEWDDENEEHVGRHIDPAIVHEFIEAGDWIQVRNKKQHSSGYVRLIGANRDGLMITVVLAPTHRSKVWRPVTAWWATETETEFYERQKGNRFAR